MTRGAQFHNLLGPLSRVTPTLEVKLQKVSFRSTQKRRTYIKALEEPHAVHGFSRGHSGKVETRLARVDR
ncbi:unnamed protein product [Boreogadus saida]